MMTCRTGRRGVALVFALVVVVLLAALAALTLTATIGRIRFADAGRDAVEGRLVVGEALAAARVDSVGSLSTLSGSTTWLSSGSGPIPGWTYEVGALRSGAIIVLRGTAYRRRPDGTLQSRQTATLLLFPHPADTLRVIGTSPRW